MTKTVTIYSTPSCHYCNLAKLFFKEHNIAYTEHNVAADKTLAREMIQKSGQMGVPVICIDDALIVGFDEQTLRQQLLT